jgi:hypothetical protein
LQKNSTKTNPLAEPWFYNKDNEGVVQAKGEDMLNDTYVSKKGS